MRRFVPTLLAGVALLALPATTIAKTTYHHHVRANRATPPALSISVLSSRADLVSGGDALLAIGGVDSRSGLHVTVGGADQSSAFSTGSDGRIEGVVTGLGMGANRVVASAPGRTAAQITLTNHPIGGPVFSGPQIQPWQCQAGALDKQCDAKPTFSYFYKPAVGTPGASAAGSSVASSFQPYDPNNPPSDSQI